MFQSGKLKLGFPILCSLLLIACGGGGGETSGTTSTTIEKEPNQPSTKPNIDYKYGSFKILNTGIKNQENLDFSPFQDNSQIEITAVDNSVWNLAIMTPSNSLSTHINPLSSFYITIDNNDMSKITGLNYRSSDLIIECSTNCDKIYKYEIQKESNGKTYFILNADGIQVTGSKEGKPFSENTIINGSIKFEINSDWPVFLNKNRFKVLDYFSDISINDKKIELTSVYTHQRLILTYKLDDALRELSFDPFDSTGKQKFSEGKVEAKTADDIGVYAGYWGEDFSYNLNYEKGIQEFKFINNIFSTPIEYIERPNIKLSGNLTQQIPYGAVRTGNEIFTIDLIGLYASNESKYFQFHNSALNTVLNVKYDTVTHKINLAYQTPKQNVVNVNIHEKWNCQLVDGTCNGISINEAEGTILFENVLLDDGRKLNGVLKNVGVNPLKR